MIVQVIPRKIGKHRHIEGDCGGTILVECVGARFEYRPTFAASLGGLVAAAILLLATAVLIVRYGSNRFPTAEPTTTDEPAEQPR